MKITIIIIVLSMIALGETQILYEDFESGWDTAGNSCNNNQNCASNEPWGAFSDCNDLNEDWVLCGGNNAYQGNRALLMQDMDEFNHGSGVIFELNYSGYDEIRLEFAHYSSDLEIGEFCRVWINNSLENITVYECTDNSACDQSGNRPNTEDYNHTRVNLTKMSVNITDRISFHFGGKSSNRKDYCYYDMVNITGYGLDQSISANVTDILPGDHVLIEGIDFSADTNISISISFNNTILSEYPQYVSSSKIGAFNYTHVSNSSDSDGHYFIEVTETNNSFKYASMNISINSSNEIGPIIDIIGDTNMTDSNGVVIFKYNVSNSAVVNCSLVINNKKVVNDTSVTENIEQRFFQNLNTGFYNWSVICIDTNNREGQSVTGTINVINEAACSDVSEIIYQQE